LMGLTSRRKRLTSFLAEAIEEHLPQFEPHSVDYQMVIYACRDLEEWMKCKWALNSSYAIYERLEETLDCEREEFSIFLDFWTSHWLEKWKERVTLLLTKPKLPPSVLEKIREAKTIYQGIEQRNELKEMVTQKLVRQGEVCMPGFIAEHLIIQEIAERQSVSGILDITKLTPLDIFNSLSRRISGLPREKGPLIYLRIKPYML